jgi:hypothetical protein
MPNITKKQLTAALKLYNQHYREHYLDYPTDEENRDTDIDEVANETAETILDYVRQVKAAEK